MQASTYYPTVAHIVADLDDEIGSPFALAPRRPNAQVVSGRLTGAREVQRLNVRRRLFAGWAELDSSIARSLYRAVRKKTTIPQGSPWAGADAPREPDSAGATPAAPRVVSGRQ